MEQQNYEHFDIFKDFSLHFTFTAPKQRLKHDKIIIPHAKYGAEKVALPA